ncbi:MAG: DUF1801 domain-containing protein [Pseudomonadota bacterium]
MSENKTRITDINPEDYIGGIEHPTRRADAETLNALFRRITGWTPRMWGPSLIGYGSYHYRYDTGREGDMLATGFAAAKARLSLYIMPGYADFQPLLDRLGKHKTGKACLYINKLADVDTGVLEEIIRAGLADLGEKYPVTPT